MLFDQGISDFWIFTLTKIIASNPMTMPPSENKQAKTAVIDQYRSDEKTGTQKNRKRKTQAEGYERVLFYKKETINS